MASAVKIGVVYVALPDASNVTEKVLVPSLKSTTAPGVPVKVNVPAVPEQTVLAVKVAVGEGGEQSITTQLN